MAHAETHAATLSSVSLQYVCFQLHCCHGCLHTRRNRHVVGSQAWLFCRSGMTCWWQMTRSGTRMPSMTCSGEALCQTLAGPTGYFGESFAVIIDSHQHLAALELRCAAQASPSSNCSANRRPSCNCSMLPHQVHALSLDPEACTLAHCHDFDPSLSSCQFEATIQQPMLTW